MHHARRFEHTCALMHPDRVIQQWQAACLGCQGAKLGSSCDLAGRERKQGRRAIKVMHGIALHVRQQQHQICTQIRSWFDRVRGVWLCLSQTFGEGFTKCMACCGLIYSQLHPLGNRFRFRLQIPADSMVSWRAPMAACAPGTEALEAPKEGPLLICTLSPRTLGLHGHDQSPLA